MSSPDLAQALEFTPDDLAVNRTGSLSDKQRDSLRKLRWRSVIIGLALIVVFIFVATGFLFVGQQNDSPILRLVGVGVTLCNAAMLGVFARYWLRLDSDIRGGQVTIISGRAERVLKVTRGQRVTNYVLKIGGESLPVPRDTLTAFEHLSEYRVYRTPAARILLSAEQI